MFSSEAGSISKWPTIRPEFIEPNWCAIANRLLGYLEAMAANHTYISESDLKQLKYELGLLPYGTIIKDTPKANFK